LKFCSYLCKIRILSIEENRFNSCGFTTITIPDSVTSIGTSAFASCSNLEEIVIPDSVEVIGSAAFAYCYFLKNVSLPASVISIGTRAFQYCYDMENVFYEGSIDFPSSRAFEFSHMNALCVSPDYYSSSFCDVDLDSYSSLPICQQFRSMFNHCYKGTHINGDFIQHKRKNATLFESRTNGCVECHCYNESGAVSWALCNATDDVTRICIDDRCVETNNTSKGKEWSVVLEIEGIKPSELNATEIINEITSLTGISEDELSVGIEISKSGYISRVIVYVADEETTAIIATAVEGIDKGKECEYGFLCRTKSVRVQSNESSNSVEYISLAYHVDVKIFTMVILMVLEVIVS